MKKIIQIEIGFPDCDMLNLSDTDLVALEFEAMDVLGIVEDVEEGRWTISSKEIKPIDHSKLHDMAEKYLKENYPCCDINIHPHIRCSYKDGYIAAKKE